MATVKYTDDHEWISVDGEEATVGITDYAQEQLGDVVFVELPDVGKTVGKSDEAAVVESVKAAGEVYAPVGGEITAVNEDLNDTPGAINEDPTGKGWLFKLKINDEAELEDLMDEAAYKDYVEGL